MKRSLLALVILAIGCMPGEPSPELVRCPCFAGTHCVGDLCVPGSVPGSEPDAAPPPPPDGPCQPLGFASAGEVEARFIAPRCGVAMCHGVGAAFPPKNLDQVAQIRSALVGTRAQLACRQDFYVNRADPAKSFLLAKVEATTPMVTCPSGGSGGSRMPNVEGKLGVAGPRLGDDELACLRWWVFKIAKE
jgi:hypothetical protein